jgi:hypothetical protein
MAIDFKNLPKGKIGCGALLVVFIIGSLLFLRSFRHPFLNDPPDYNQLLAACQQIIQNPEKYPTNRPDVYREKGVLIDFGRPHSYYGFPMIIRDLYPYHMVIYDDHLNIVLRENLVVTAYAVNARTEPAEKDKKLIDGLYIDHVK